MIDSEMRYKERYTKPFLKDVKVIKKDKILLDRLNKKIEKILENPEHYPPKRYELKGKRSTHVGSYVILFAVVFGSPFQYLSEQPEVFVS
jgi:mRNA-degrading endonuclease RelE of RelBE toxin-antitoxin system